MICSLPVEAYVVLQYGKWEGSECGNRSYAGNVSLHSARAGPEKPTTLFKEMAVRGPSAALSLPLHFSVSRFANSPPFLPCTRMIIIFLCGMKVYFRTCWEGEHAHKEESVPTNTSSVLVAWFG